MKQHFLPWVRINGNTTVLTVLTLVAIMAIFGFADTARAQTGGYTIDGSVPDLGVAEFGDPFGNTNELNPINGSTTKLEVINTDALPTLGLTNPAAKSDYVRVWLDTNVDANDDVWLYFAWQRDGTTGSTVIMFEFEQAGIPPGCDYSGTRASLIANCNPFSGRQPGDFIIVWDQQGHNIVISTRTFTFTDNNPANGQWDGPIAEPLQLSAIVTRSSPTAIAANDGTLAFGEAAINLTTSGIFPQTPTSCLTVGNVIPSTVTGNSDTADFEDLVAGDFASVVNISNCGEVRITKQTLPAGNTGSFPYTLNRTDNSPLEFGVSPAVQKTGTLTGDNESDLYIDLKTGNNYTLAEGALASPWALSAITCNTNGVNYNVNPAGQPFEILPSITTSCVITNLFQTGQLVIIKDLINDNGGTNDNTDFNFTVTGSFPVNDGQPQAFSPSGITTITVPIGSYSVTEAPAAGYTTTYAPNPCTNLQVTNNGIATCTITNDDISPSLTLVKEVINDSGGNASPSDWTLIATGPTSFSGAGPSVSNGASFDAGIYVLSESGDSDNYSSLPWSCVGGQQNGASITIGLAESATCTITNDDDAPGLKLVKNASPQVYSTVGTVINYTYTLSNTGTALLSQPFVVTDDKATVSCPALPASIAPGESINCTATYIITQADLDLGSVTNVAQAQAKDPFNNDVFSNVDEETVVASQEPSIEVSKVVEQESYVAEGDAIDYTLVATNTGNVTLSGVEITDPKITIVDCTPPQPATLLPGATISCSGIYTATQADVDAGQLDNIGTATGIPPSGPVVTDTNDATIPAIQTPAIAIDKVVEQESYDAEGDVIVYTLVATNTGNVTLSGVEITDPKITIVDCTPPQPTTLLPGATISCSGIYTATQADVDAGQIDNTGTATGTPPTGPDVTDTDDAIIPAIQAPAIVIVKTGDSGPVTISDIVHYTITVINIGNVTLTDVTITDAKLGLAENIGTLQVGQSAQITDTYGPVTESDLPGPIFNTAGVIGTPPLEPPTTPVTDTHEVTVTVNAAISITKYTNGEDANLPPGPVLDAGSQVVWRYVVTNTSNVTLNNVTVTDNQIDLSAICPPQSLAAGATMTCSVTGIAEAGLYSNTATVIGTPAGNFPPVTDDDPSHYFGVAAGIDIEKSTNGLQADRMPGLVILAGEPIIWRYVVTNRSNVPLSNIVVTDDQGVTVTCPKTTLAPDEVMTCTAIGIAQPGLYRNIGTVEGETPTGQTVADFDPSHYFGVTVGIDIEKSTNGDDADLPPGPIIPVGAPVEWNYVVTNRSNVPLSNTVVTDDQIGAITCPQTTLAPDESMTCTANGTATPGQYGNVSTVVGERANGQTVTDADPSHYFGASPGIDIEKSTNGVDADDAPGPLVNVGASVTWRYVVINTSNVAVNNIVVSDDQGEIVTCPQTTLAPGESMTCTASGIALPGLYANTGTVEGTTSNGQPVSDADPSHYFGAAAGIDIEKSTNGVDADQPPGPVVLVGDPVTWRYVVTNRSNVALNNVTVTDDQIGAITCPQTTLAPDEVMTCTANGTATPGQYANLATVQGETPTGLSLTDVDSSHYLGLVPGIDIEKTSNGLRADQPAGLVVSVGDPVQWHYIVTNRSNVDLINIVVTDDQGVTVTCPKTTLAPDEIMTCTGSGIAQPGLYRNVATVVGEAPNGQSVTDSDPSHYFGVTAGIDIEKSTNGDDADLPPGPVILVDDAVVWHYDVTNRSNVPLDNIVVTDDQGVSITCPKTILAPNEVMSCTATGTATPGQYENVATVVGTQPSGQSVTDADPSHYFGAVPGINIEKLTNNFDADEPPGPAILVGDPVTWRYLVNNTSNVAVNNIVVSDDQGEIVTCPQTTLAPGESMTCTANGIALPGLYANTGIVEGTTSNGQPVSNADPSHYFGADPGIDIEKSTNGVDADLPPGPLVNIGDPVTWSYVVTNRSNVALNNVTVTDDQSEIVTCPQTTLAPGEIMICTANGIAIPGQYENNGIVEGTPPTGLPVSDVDPSHYFGVAPGIDIEKFTNDADADQPPGPLVIVGDPIIWNYVVTNRSNVPLDNIVVTDDQIGAITCPQTTLAPDESMTCTANGTATPGQYKNIAAVQGETPTGQSVSDVDLSHYLGLVPGIDIEKTTNALRADQPAGLVVSVGDPVQWHYIVTNRSNVDLINIVVTDDQGVTVTCPKTTLAPDEIMTCTGSGIAQPGLYRNVATVVGEAPNGQSVTDSDPSHYFGVTVGIDIEKSTNGDDADLPPGPVIAVGDAVEWHYDVTNRSNVPLGNIVVTDDQGVTVTCPKTTLAPDEVMTCTATGTATPGQYENVATVVGTQPSGQTVTDADPSHYFGAAIGPEAVGIDIEKFTNDVDADEPPGPAILVGDPVTWRYLVNNTSDVAVNNIVVSDDQGEIVTCPQTTLAPGESMTCTANGIALPGLYANTGIVEGTASSGEPVSDADPSYYLGADPGIDIEKSTNGVDADLPPGPLVNIGDPVTWSYVVTNRSNVPLNNVSVTDDQGETVTCPKTTLAPGEIMICTANGTAIPGQYENNGIAEGTPPTGPSISDVDPSHYFGVASGIDIEKSTNGVDADQPPGPLVNVGDPIVWNYVVTNISNVPLNNVTVTDDQGETVTCPKTTLAPDESMTCTASGTATLGQYSNNSIAEGTLPNGQTVSDADPSNYFGVVPGIDIEKSTNGVDGDQPPGVVIPVGDPVEWRYVVTNRSNVPLSNVVVSDDQAEIVTCPQTTLAPGEIMFCTANGIAIPGQYANTGAVVGETPNGQSVSDVDPSHYYGVIAGIDIEKSTNGFDADLPPGPLVNVGDPIVWNYAVTNISNVPLNNITVTDDQGEIVTCPQTTLAPGESMTCTANGSATLGQYSNSSTVVGARPDGQTVSDADPSNYFGVVPGIDIEKSTNGADADLPPGLGILVGEPVIWLYVVTNRSNVPLSNVTVTDDEGEIVTCPQTTLQPSEIMTCMAIGIAIPGLYANTGTVEGTTPTGQTVADVDPSHYYGVIAGIDIEKSTNGVDADLPPGPLVLVGDPVEWRYVVTNTSNVPLSDVVVTDDQGVTVNCPQATLAVGESMTCTANDIATLGQYSNSSTVVGARPDGQTVTDADPSNYFGITPGIDIKKSTNGVDADLPPGPLVLVGDPVEWRYVVTNTGNLPVSNLVVSDNQGETVICPQSTLAPGESMTCTADGIARDGQYENTGFVEGISSDGQTVSDADPSHYFGFMETVAEIVINKYTNSVDADEPPGPTVDVGSQVVWTYVVTNTGSVPILNVTVSDDQLGVVSCPKTVLAPGEVMTCTMTGTAILGQYANIGTVEGVTTDGQVVTDTDPSHYLGNDPTDLPKEEQPLDRSNVFLPRIGGGTGER